MGRKKRMQDKVTEVAPQPVEVRKAHPAAWKRALGLAKGDARRLTVGEDGSVIIHNKRKR